MSWQTAPTLVVRKGGWQWSKLIIVNTWHGKIKGLPEMGTRQEIRVEGMLKVSPTVILLMTLLSYKYNVIR